MIGGEAVNFTGIGALIGIPMVIWGLVVANKTDATDSTGGWVGDCPICDVDIICTASEATKQAAFESNHRPLPYQDVCGIISKLIQYVLNYLNPS